MPHNGTPTRDLPCTLHRAVARSASIVTQDVILKDFEFKNHAWDPSREIPSLNEQQAGNKALGLSLFDAHGKTLHRILTTSGYSCFTLPCGTRLPDQLWACPKAGRTGGAKHYSLSPAVTVTASSLFSIYNSLPWQPCEMVAQAEASEAPSEGWGPDEETYNLCLALESVVTAAVASAPNPPAGWSGDEVIQAAIALDVLQTEKLDWCALIHAEDLHSLCSVMAKADRQRANTVLLPMGEVNGAVFCLENADRLDALQRGGMAAYLEEFGADWGDEESETSSHARGTAAIAQQASTTVTSSIGNSAGVAGHVASLIPAPSSPIPSQQPASSLTGRGVTDVPTLHLTPLRNDQVTSTGVPPPARSGRSEATAGCLDSTALGSSRTASTTSPGDATAVHTQPRVIEDGQSESPL